MRALCVVVAVVTLVAPGARAQEPVLWDPSSAPSEPLPPVHPRVALMAGWGGPSGEDWPYGFGAGVRGGVHFGERGLYLGAAVVQHLGAHQKFFGGQVERSSRLGYAALELGYESRYRSFAICPWGGVGAAWLVSTWCLNGNCADRTKDGTGVIALTGISLYQHFGSVFVGVDGRVFFQTTTQWESNDEIAGAMFGLAAFGLVGWAP